MSNLEKLLAEMQAGKHDGAWDDLPTFGGDEPADTREVWSWDESRVIAGTCSDDIQIVSRAEWFGEK